MAKQNVSQSMIHTVTVQMTVKVNSEFYVQGHSVKAINLLDSQQLSVSKRLVEVLKRPHR